VTTTLTAHPEAKHWIFYSCNDDGVLGGVRATENQGIPSENVIGVGIDGSRSCGLFGEGKPSGFRGSMYIDSAKEGATAVQLLYAAVKENKPLPQVTYVTADLITLETFPKFKDKLCKN
jgi:L-arabinose transport system substrate-binding protein